MRGRVTNIPATCAYWYHLTPGLSNSHALHPARGNVRGKPVVNEVAGVAVFRQIDYVRWGLSGSETRVRFTCEGALFRAYSAENPLSAEQNRGCISIYNLYVFRGVQEVRGPSGTCHSRTHLPRTRESRSRSSPRALPISLVFISCKMRIYVYTSLGLRLCAWRNFDALSTRGYRDKAHPEPPRIS